MEKISLSKNEKKVFRMVMNAKRGYETGRINDPRFGYVKTYPDVVLKELFGQSYPYMKFC